MKNTTQLILIAGLASMMAGCASTGGYFVDRGRDAKDVFSATIGRGIGAKARVGPLATGLIYSENIVGLQDGVVISLFDENGDFIPRKGHDAYFLLVGWEMPPHAYDKVTERKKYYYCSHFLGVLAPMPEGMNVPPSYYTDLNVAAGLGITLKVGFNPGELLDFVLGWASIDIYNDDIEEKESNNPSHHTTGSRADAQPPAAGER